MFKIHRVAEVFPTPRPVGSALGCHGITRCGLGVYQSDERRPPSTGTGALRPDESIGKLLFGTQPGDPDFVCDQCFTMADLPRLIAEGWR